jgi:hypothetical protein
MYLVFGLVATVFDRYLTLGVYGMAPTGTLLRSTTFYSDNQGSHVR